MLKTIVLGFMVLTVPITAILYADMEITPPAILWEKNLEDAMAKAKAAGKPVLLDFFMIA